MRRVALFLMTCSVCVAPAQAEEETFVDDQSALVVRVPEGWSQDHNREHGRIRFAGIHELAPAQYTLFTVETGPAAGFTGPAWLAAEEAYTRAHLTVKTPFETEPAFELAGKAAPHYAVAAEGPGFNVRIRAAAVVHGGRLYRVSEHSFNGAYAVAGPDLDRLWQGISFKEEGADAFQDEGYDDSGEEDAEDDSEAPEPEVDVAPAADFQPRKVEDKPGNYTLELPAGWEVTREPQDETEMADRMWATRHAADGSDLMEIRVLQITSSRGETFTIESPTDVLKWFTEERKYFQQFFGEGSAKSVRPEVDEGTLLGDAEKSGQFEFRNITVQEQIKIDKAEKLRNRGDKTVKVPEYKPVVVRGRIALLSPHIYFVIFHFRRDVADHPEVLAEYKKILDSWKFIQSEAKPPPLQVGPEFIEDTTAAPENAKDRKGSLVHMAKGRKIYKLKIDFVVPAGFQRIEKNLGPDASLLVVAQDKNNNWVKIVIAHQNANALGERQKKYPPKKQQYSEWKSNWESKARGAKMREKPSRVSLGKVRGDGYELVEGTVENFRGTFTGLLFDKSGWRTFIEMETRGKGDQVFEKEIKEFFKRLKFKKVK